MTKVEIFEGADRQWYWRARCTRNHRIIATGGEGYATASNARRAARRIGGAMLLTWIETIKPRMRPGDYRRG